MPPVTQAIRSAAIAVIGVISFTLLYYGAYITMGLDPSAAQWKLKSTDDFHEFIRLSGMTTSDQPYYPTSVVDLCILYT